MAGFSFVLSESGEVLLDGALRVENAAEIRTKLLEMIEKKDGITFVVGEEADTDLSFLQLLCSAHQSAVRLKRTFEVVFSGSSQFIRALSEAGFLKKRDYSCDAGEACFRVEGGDL